MKIQPTFNEVSEFNFSQARALVARCVARGWIEGPREDPALAILPAAPRVANCRKKKRATMKRRA